MPCLRVRAFSVFQELPLHLPYNCHSLPRLYPVSAPVSFPVSLPVSFPLILFHSPWHTWRSLLYSILYPKTSFLLLCEKLFSSLSASISTVCIIHNHFSIINYALNMHHGNRVQRGPHYWSCHGSVAHLIIITCSPDIYLVIDEKTEKAFVFPKSIEDNRAICCILSLENFPNAA